jgi:fucose permease
VFPFIFPNDVYTGLVIGTVIFSASSGFNEVLANPLILSIPSDNPDKEISKLHAVYPWGVVGVIVVGTAFLFGVGSENWQWLAMLFLLIPITSTVLFFSTDMPEIETPQKASGIANLLKNKMLWLCVVAIFFGGAAEMTMTQWCSAYLEKSMGIPKIWGDLLGMAIFALFLGLGRTLYTAKGKNIGRVLILGSVGAFLCLEKFSHSFIFTPSSIPHGESEKQDSRGEQYIQHLEFPAPLEPLSVAYVGKTETDKKRGIGRIEDI